MINKKDLEMELYAESAVSLVSQPMFAQVWPKTPLEPSDIVLKTPVYGIRVVLGHTLPDGSEREVGYVSKTLATIEANYSQIEKKVYHVRLELTNFMLICMNLHSSYTQTIYH